MKKKSKTKATETIAPSAYSQPYIDSAAATLKPAYDASLAQANKFLPQLDKASGYYGDVLDGKFMGGNPWLSEMIANTNSDVTDGVASEFMNAGRYGSGYNQKILADALARNTTGLRYQDYATERGYMDDAGRNIAGLATTATALPMIPSQGYSEGVGGLLGKYITGNSQSTTKSSPSLLSSLAKVAQIAAAASDRRLKVDVEKVGEEPDGLGIYKYRYVTDNPTDPVRTGVMADEVEKLRPWALGPERGGFKTVNYGRL